LYVYISYIYLMESSSSSSSSSHDVHILVNQEDDEYERRLNDELISVDAQSAITMSPENSDSGSGSGSDSEPYNQDDHIEYKAITYKEVEAKIKRENTSSDIINEMDILMVYVKNQKMIYVDAKDIMSMRLYFWGFPTICITITASALSSFVGNSIWIITFLNAVLTVFITLLFVLKMETVSAYYEMVSSRYIKLHEDLDTFTSKLAFVCSKREKEKLIFSKMKKIEGKIAEIKEDSHCELPQYIRYLYPRISKINIFSSIYSVDLHRKNLIHSLRNVINETRCIRAKWEKEFAIKKRDSEYTINGFYRLKETNRLNTLADQKDQLKREISKYKNTCSFIDGIFQQEINDKKNKELWWLYNICFCNEVAINDKVLKYD
jgi:hypothetical protein